MEDFFEFLFADVLLSLIGFIYLHLRYFNRARTKQKLVTDYENSYGNVGRVVTLNIVAALGALLVSGIVLMAVFMTLRGWLRG